MPLRCALHGHDPNPFPGPRGLAFTNRDRGINSDRTFTKRWENPDTPEDDVHTDARVVRARNGRELRRAPLGLQKSRELGATERETRHARGGPVGRRPDASPRISAHHAAKSPARRGRPKTIRPLFTIRLPPASSRGDLDADQRQTRARRVGRHHPFDRDPPSGTRTSSDTRGRPSIEVARLPVESHRRLDRIPHRGAEGCVSCEHLLVRWFR
jgi:hypothetical protein